MGAVNKLFGNRARLYGLNAGLHVLLELPDFRDEGELVQKAAAHGVRVYSTSPFWLDAKRRRPAARLMLGYVALSESDIPKAVALLHRAWF